MVYRNKGKRQQRKYIQKTWQNVMNILDLIYVCQKWIKNRLFYVKYVCGCLSSYFFWIWIGSAKKLLQPIHTHISVKLLLKLGTKYWAVEKAREGGSKSLSHLRGRARCAFSRLPEKLQALLLSLFGLSSFFSFSWSAFFIWPVLGLLWCLVCFGLPWTALVCLELLRSYLNCFGLPWTALVCLELNWSALNCFGLPWTA